VSKDEQIAVLSSENVSLSSENACLSSEIASLKHELSQLKKLIYGSKSEKHVSVVSDEQQLNLFAESDTDMVQTTEPQEVKEQITYTRKKNTTKHPGRHPLPDHLPVQEVIIEPDVDTTHMTKVSEVITDTLEYTPASLVIKRIIRPQYAKADGQGIMIGQLPDRPIPKAIAEASLLAYIFVFKFVDHQPFYRIIVGFKRDYNWTLSPSTLNNWFSQCCILLEPLYNLMKEKLLDCGYIQADESPIKVLDKKLKGKSHHGYQWVYHSPEEKIIVFHYRKGRGMHGPKEFLCQYKGILQCDGYTVYDKIGKSAGITLAGCTVHVRRKYVEAKENDRNRAIYALDIFKKIYALEAKAKDSENKTKYRNQHIRPLYLQLKEWIEENSNQVVPKSPIGKAMSYTLSQWDKISNIFSDGKIELDNNLIENKIRPLALGRKNYLFAGSHNGAQRIAMMYSFMATCKANNVNPYQWLKHTLQNIGQASIQDLEKFLPSKFNT